MDKVFDIIGKGVIAVGGASAVIIAVSVFISKIWADLFMKKKVAEYDKQIEYLKNSLVLEVERYKAINEQIIYKNLKIFDVEFNIYQEITPKLIDATNAVIESIMDMHEQEDCSLQKKAKEKCFELHLILTRYSSFMDKEMYEKYRDFILLCYKYLQDNNITYGVSKEKKDTSNLIYNASNELLDKTRAYLRKMATVS
jgi:hypothetical protein